MPKEYIERETVLKYLVPHADNEDDLQPTVVMEFVESIPAADVVEVVRCGQCRFGRYIENENKVLCVRMKNMGDGELYIYNEPTDYCSYGERKDGADNG